MFMNYIEISNVFPRKVLSEGIIKKHKVFDNSELEVVYLEILKSAKLVFKVILVFKFDMSKVQKVIL